MSEDVNDIVDSMFTDDSTKPESNWFTFEKVGDTVGGTLLEVYENDTKFGPQTVYVIKKADGTDVNVALKNTTHKMNIQQLKAAAIGDMLAFRLKEFVDTGKVNPAKSIEVRIRHVNK